MDEDGVEDPLKALLGRFGIPSFHPLQRMAIVNVLEAAGRKPGQGGGAEDDVVPNQVVILPTGAGKSLCFQAPSLLLVGPTLVVYPLLALMEDQRRRLRDLAIEAVVFRGGQDRGERERGVEALRSGAAKLALANPEVLADPRLGEAFAKLGIAHLAVDEAHCVTEWGETFRPAYLRLGEFAERTRPRAFSAFTATASPAVLESMTSRLFGDSPWSLVAGSPDRPNIHWSVVRTLSRARTFFDLLEKEARPLLVFASSRSGVEKLAAAIRSRRRDLDLRFYHAGLEREEKKDVETWFFSSRDGVLVATCAYGMGVDKRDIRTVIHWDPPATVESYLQEAGRGGRDGNPARAVLLLAGKGEARSPGGDEADEGRMLRGKAFLDWANRAEGCRRSGLLELMGAELKAPCGGCDRCDGVDTERREGEAEALAFVRRHSRRWNRAGIAQRLGERRGRGSRLHGPGLALPFEGALGRWRDEEILSALGVLIEEGRLREIGKGPWKGLLALPGRSASGRAASRREEAGVALPDREGGAGR